MSPTLRCTFPPVFSIVPRSRKSGFPVALPAFSFTLPFASLNPPLILSFVLDFIRTKSRVMEAAVVIWLKLRRSAEGWAKRRDGVRTDKTKPIVRLADCRLLVSAIAVFFTLALLFLTLLCGSRPAITLALARKELLIHRLVYQTSTTLPTTTSSDGQLNRTALGVGLVLSSWKPRTQCIASSYNSFPRARYSSAVAPAVI